MLFSNFMHSVIFQVLGSTPLTSDDLKNISDFADRAIAEVYTNFARIVPDIFTKVMRFIVTPSVFKEYITHNLTLHNAEQEEEVLNLNSQIFEDFQIIQNDFEEIKLQENRGYYLPIIIKGREDASSIEGFYKILRVELDGVNLSQISMSYAFSTLKKGENFSEDKTSIYTQSAPYLVFIRMPYSQKNNREVIIKYLPSYMSKDSGIVLNSDELDTKFSTPSVSSMASSLEKVYERQIVLLPDDLIILAQKKLKCFLLELFPVIDSSLYSRSMQEYLTEETTLRRRYNIKQQQLFSWQNKDGKLCRRRVEIPVEQGQDRLLGSDSQRVRTFWEEVQKIRNKADAKIDEYREQFFRENS